VPFEPLRELRVSKLPRSSVTATPCRRRLPLALRNWSGRLTSGWRSCTGEDAHAVRHAALIATFPYSAWRGVSLSGATTTRLSDPQEILFTEHYLPPSARKHFGLWTENLPSAHFRTLPALGNQNKTRAITGPRFATGIPPIHLSLTLYTTKGVFVKSLSEVSTLMHRPPTTSARRSILRGIPFEHRVDRIHLESSDRLHQNQPGM